MIGRSMISGVGVTIGSGSTGFTRRFNSFPTGVVVVNITASPTVVPFALTATNRA
jgi:hypothetical protein